MQQRRQPKLEKEVMEPRYQTLAPIAFNPSLVSTEEFPHTFTKGIDIDIDIDINCDMTSPSANNHHHLQASSPPNNLTISFTNHSHQLLITCSHENPLEINHSHPRPRNGITGLENSAESEEGI